MMSDFNCEHDSHNLSDGKEKVTFGRVVFAVIFFLVVAYIGSLYGCG